MNQDTYIVHNSSGLILIFSIATKYGLYLFHEFFVKNCIFDLKI